MATPEAPKNKRCVFCGTPHVDNVCGMCIKKYLACGHCGYISRAYINSDTAFTQGQWLGMPNACKACGLVAVNHAARAVGLKQTNFMKLSDNSSFIRRRLCQENN